MRVVLTSVLALAIVAPGCTTPLPILEVDAPAEADAPPLDAPPERPDAAPELDAPRASDAGTDDAGTDAAMPPDAPPDTDAGSSCTARYGTLVGFMLCGETATTCEIYVRTTGSCAIACSSRGGTCLEAFNDSAMTCTRLEPIPCTMNFLQQICICSR